MEWGATPEQLEEAELHDAEPEPFAVWPENIEAVALFTQMASQWQVAMSMNGTLRWIGLRYESLEAVLRLQRVARTEWARLFSQVRSMEAEARGILNR